jgi:hypothetical protein
MSPPLASLALVLALTASNEQPALRVGLGLGLDAESLVGIEREQGEGIPVSLVNLHVPIRIGGWLRLEPELGLRRRTTERLRVADVVNDSLAEGDAVLTETLLRVAFGAAWSFAPEPDVALHLGGKVGFVRSSWETTFTPDGGEPATDDDARTDTWVGLTAGGEYFLARSFSLGGEIELDHAWIGLSREEEERVEEFGGPATERLLSTNGRVVVRWYYR